MDKPKGKIDEYLAEADQKRSEANRLSCAAINLVNHESLRFELSGTTSKIRVQIDERGNLRFGDGSMMVYRADVAKFLAWLNHWYGKE